MWDVDAVRSDFPILDSCAYDRPLVYLDNSATTHKPLAVLDALQDYYTRRNSNVHRSAHYLAQQAGEAYERSRETVREFVNARSLREIVFTSGTTEAINIVATCFCKPPLRAGENVVVSAMEHHSNLVPWQMVCRERGASLRVIPVNDDGSLDVTAGEELVTDATRLVAITAVSNVLGTVTPIERLIEKAHSHHAAVLVDAAQGVPHQPMDVQQLDCDFCAFSAHKLYAATGTGVLYGKREHLEQMRPWQYGGGMIGSVRFDETSFAEPPYRFEAGTRHVAGAVALAAAIRYVNNLGWDALEAHEQNLLRYATTRLGEQDGLTIHGTAEPKRSLVSFTLDGVNPSDAAAVLDKLGIAVRAGHHCAQPLMERLGVSGTVRASFACYNTRDEVDRLIEGIGRVRRMLT